jgi:hypothetical protein
VVDAGFGGIAAGVKMKRSGIRTFTIYESSLGVGEGPAGWCLPGADAVEDSIDEFSGDRAGLQDGSIEDWSDQQRRGVMRVDGPVQFVVRSREFECGLQTVGD